MIITNTATVVTLVEEIKLDEELYLSRQSNGAIVLTNFASDATDEQLEDVILMEIHFDAAQRQQLLGMLTRAQQQF